MHSGMNAENDFAHQLNEGGKQESACILFLGGMGKKIVDALGIEESFQDRSSHHADGPFLNEGGKDGVQQHGRHLPRSLRAIVT
jgi:hypothetical protein